MLLNQPSFDPIYAGLAMMECNHPRVKIFVSSWLMKWKSRGPVKEFLSASKNCVKSSQEFSVLVKGHGVKPQHKILWMAETRFSLQVQPSVSQRNTSNFRGKKCECRLLRAGLGQIKTSGLALCVFIPENYIFYPKKRVLSSSLYATRQILRTRKRTLSSMLMNTDWAVLRHGAGHIVLIFSTVPSQDLGVTANNLHRNPCCFTADLVKPPLAQQPCGFTTNTKMSWLCTRQCGNVCVCVCFVTSHLTLSASLWVWG